MMKREAIREIDHSITMANYLMYLSHGSDDQLSTTSNSNNNRVFECKTCKRQFPSFQALGGHRASHKKPRLMVENNGEMINHVLSSPTPIKPKRHECSICGLEFSIGQALGGHMRRHRSRGTNLNDNINYNNNSNTTTTMSCCSSGGSSLDSSTKIKDGKKRVLVLDLNLTPFENDLEILKIGNQGTDGAALVDYLY